MAQRVLLVEDKEQAFIRKFMLHFSKAAELNSKGRALPAIDSPYSSFIAYLKLNRSQRDIDLALVLSNIRKTWRSVHVTVAELGEELSPAEDKALSYMVSALKRLDLFDVFTEGLRDDICHWLDRFTPAHF